MLVALFTSCNAFLDQDVPQAILSEEQVSNPQYVDNLVISAYAIFISAEDINSSFSMWNFDVRSDDAYKGGNGTSDGDVFHQLEISQGILTTNCSSNSCYSLTCDSNKTILVNGCTFRICFPSHYFICSVGRFNYNTELNGRTNGNKVHRNTGDRNRCNRNFNVNCN